MGMLELQELDATVSAEHRDAEYKVSERQREKGGCL